MPTRWLPESATRPAILALALAAACLALLAQPSPPQARADLPCEIVSGPAGAISGAVGLGNPVGDACEAVTGPLTEAVTAPVTGALKDIGRSVFGQLTSWVAEGASWLMGKVVVAIDTSTTPRLDSEGFLAAYGRMAAIGVMLAAAMLLLAILEGIAQGSPGLLVRVVLVNLPLAFLGTTLAYAVVQLLLTTTDGLSAAVASASHHDSTRFFEASIGDLGRIGGTVGKAAGAAGDTGATSEAAGSVAVPLFVGFVAAIVGAFAAFAVWLELVMRDAAVYAVSLFMPLALAASIWPRWTGVLRRSAELLVAVIGSKFVIVAVVSLAASLVSEGSGSVEHVLAAAALMLLACFAPFVLLRLIPFSEAALGAAYGRRSAASTVHHGAIQTASNAQMVRSMGHSGEGGSGVSLWEASAPGQGGKGGGPSSPGPRPGAGGGSGEGGEGAGAAGAGAGSAGEGAAASGAAGVPVAAAEGAKAGAGKLAQTATAREADPGSRPEGGEEKAGGEGAAGSSSGRPAPARPLPQEQEGPAGGEGPGAGGPSVGERPPRPAAEPPRGEDGPGGGAA